jgi:hypothetical protein
VELAVTRAGLPPTSVLRNTSRSSQAEIDAFNRLNDPASPHRVILLVNKGAEGWNCPSLFATALARKLRTSQNFVLQAASRCLEVKMTARRDDPVEGRDGLKAQRMRDLEARNPGRVLFRIAFADASVAANDVEAVRTILAG